MKHQIKRGMSAMLVLVMIVGLLSGLAVPAQAATVKNYGYRGNTATMFSSYATKFYSNNNVTYEDLAALAGSSDVSTVPSSALYLKLQNLMTTNHTHITTYKETTDYYAYTDCQGEGNVISSFYSGKEIGPEWDSGATWNREHTWPNSKGLDGDDENDIMMLRPTAVSENSARGNKAYGPSYYDPNSVSGGLYNLHGDVARIALYVYVRWGNTANMWGADGVIESKDVLLDWIEEDPVDTWELGRNDAVMSITGTRNVFVDYPELAFLLFGEEVPTGMTTPSGNTAESYEITATVNDAAMGSVSVAGSNIKAVPATGCRIEGYEVVAGDATVTQNGDLFTVSAKSDCTVQINFGVIPVPETLAEQLAAASKLNNKEYLPYTTTIEGKVSAIDEAYNTQYKNITFFVNVDGTDVYCYRVKGDGMDTLAVGDTVRVVGNLTAYYNSPQFDSTATVTILEKASGETPDVPTEPDETAGVMIDFSVLGQRVSQDKTQQVWANDGITLTNSKGQSTTDVADYYNPVRFYKSSDVTIEYPGMTKVVFHCAGGSKYSMKTSDVAHLGTATASGSVITLVLDAPVDSITYTCASNQIRYSKIEVYAEKSEEEGCKHGNLEHAEAVAAGCETEGTVEHWYCPDCEIYWLDQDLTQETTPEQLVVAPGHNYTAEVTPPTDTSDGYTTYTCTVCGHTYTTIIAHTHSGVYQEAVPATCAAPGAIAHYACSCGMNFTDEACTQTVTDITIPQQSHSFTAQVTGEEYRKAAANCSSAAVYYISCEYCGLSSKDTQWDSTFLSGEPNPEKHTGETYLSGQKDATCTLPGYTGDTHCSGCDERLVLGALITAAHSLKKVNGTEPTHKDEGLAEHYICTVCEKLFSDAEGTEEVTAEEVILQPLGHTYGDYKTNSTKHWKECSCGHVAQEGNHTFGSWKTVKKAEEDVDGRKERSCTVCGYTESKTIPAASNPSTGDMAIGMVLLIMVSTLMGMFLLVTIRPVKGKYMR